MREILEGTSNRRLRKHEDCGQGYLNFNSDDVEEEEEEYVGYSKKRGKRLISDRNVVLNLTPLRSLGYVDPGWEHGVAHDEKKKKVKCNYCGKVVSGGINRFKQHLARIPGEVAPCNEAPEEVYYKMKDIMKWHRTGAGTRRRQPDSKDISSTFYMRSDNEDEVNELEEDALRRMSNERPTIGDKRLRKDMSLAFKGVSPHSGVEPLLKKSRLDSVPLRTPNGQILTSSNQVKKGSGKKSRKEVFSAICKFFYHAGVPLQAANSQYFQSMLELVGQYGPDLVGPSSQQISGEFLEEEIATIGKYLVEYRASWAITGCSILADTWTDMKGRTLINFLVSSPHGSYFVSSVDATDLVEDGLNLFKLLDKVVEEMGEENVVQVITDNTPSFKAAGKMLEEKRRNLFWTPCATYCINHILEDFLKLKCVKECMEKAQRITKFIYNQVSLLNLMKKEFTQGRELLRPSVSKYASSFATLQNIVDNRFALRRMFQSKAWNSSRFSKSDEGKEVEKIVLNAAFWKKGLYVLKSVNPVMQVLQNVDAGGSISIPYIYNGMHRAKLDIKSVHDDDLRKYGPFWSVIDEHWKSLTYHPLYVAAYFLNPSYRYHPHFVAYPEVVRGLNECIVRVEPDNLRRNSAMAQISDYISAKADFGTELAISTRTELDPAAWWQQHGISCLELQRVAVRVLSQTCSSVGCEHKWSIYDQVYSQRHSRSAQKRVNDLIYVHYNLRLRERHIKKRSGDSISFDNVLQEQLLDDWIVDAEKQCLQEDEEMLNEENGTAYDHEDENFYEDGNAEDRNGSMELLTSADVDPVDVKPRAANDDDGDDDGGGMIFFDEEYE